MPTDIFANGSPRYDHGHDLGTGVTWRYPGSRPEVAERTCPACRHRHVAGTTCLECPSCGYGIDFTEIARAIFDGDDDVYTPGSYPRFDDAELYLWAVGCMDDEAREYHWFPDCAWLLTSLSHGGRLVVADEPPADAAERGPAADGIDQGDLSRLCRLCARLWPVPWEVRALADEPCAACGCPWPSHVAPDVSGARHWCRTGWTEVVWTGPGPGDRLVTLLPCRCDRYRAIPLDVPATAPIHADPDDRHGAHGQGDEADTDDPTTHRPIAAGSIEIPNVNLERP